MGHAAQRCRSCGAAVHRQVLDLGMSPLCESFFQEDQLDQAEQFYPLRALACEVCHLVQLCRFVVPIPERTILAADGSTA